MVLVNFEQPTACEMQKKWAVIFCLCNFDGNDVLVVYKHQISENHQDIECLFDVFMEDE
jgi:hypothetical protein